MIRYLLRKSLSWLVMVFLATNLTYFLANWFLDPEANYQERRPPIPPEQIQQMLEPYNLSQNEPLLSRWWDWLTGILLHWDWGLSPVGQSVNHQVSVRIGTSAQLLLGATILAALIGVAVGVYTASRQYKLADRIWQGVSIILLNTHVIVASLVIVLLAVQINKAAGTRIFYVTGASSPGVTGFFPILVDRLQHLILPTIVLILINYPSYHMMQRTLLLDNISADYVRTARSKGLTRQQAIRKHALRTSIIPVATSMAFSIAGIFTGAVLTETIFGWEGMGRYFTTTIAKNDVHGVVAVAAFGAAMTAVGALLSDFLLVFIDPRVRVS